MIIKNKSFIVFVSILICVLTCFAIVYAVTTVGNSINVGSDLIVTGNAGIGTTSPGARLDVTAAASSESTLGSTILLNGNFVTNDLTNWTAAAGWSAATGKAVHTAGIADTTPLTQSVSLTNGSVYEVSVTRSGAAGGHVYMTFGSLTGIYEPGIDEFPQTFTATSTGAQLLTFTPTAAFDGSVDDITVKLVTPNTTPIVELKDSTGASIIPIRGSATLFNIGIGEGTQRYITTGIQNQAVGYQAQYSMTTGEGNMANGYQAQYSMTTAGGNSANGYQAQYSMTTGNASTGYANMADGYQCQYSLTTGRNNEAWGDQAQYYLTTGSQNQATGYQSQYSLTEGLYNLATGYRSGWSLTTGSYNIAMGYQAGRGATLANAAVTDTYGILIGYNANRSVVSATELTNYIGIGYGTLIDKSNQVKIGNATTTEMNLAGAPVWSQTPDIVAAAGAISVQTAITHIVTNGVGTVLTLAAGVEGQIKYIVLKTLTSGSQTDVITPASAAGFTTITMDAVGDSVQLLYTNGKWTVVGSYSCTII